MAGGVSWETLSACNWKEHLAISGLAGRSAVEHGKVPLMGDFLTAMQYTDGSDFAKYV